MKREKDEAFGVILLFENLEACKTDGFYTKEIFSVEGRPGLWRRVPRRSTSMSKRRPGAVLGLYKGMVGEFVRDRETEEELEKAGFGIPSIQEIVLNDESLKQETTAEISDDQPDLPGVPPSDRLGDQST